MLTDLRLLLLVVIFMAFLGIYAMIKSAAVRIGVIMLIWHYVSGHTWNGKHLTDAGWFSPASSRAAHTHTGRTRRFYYRPRAHRALSRTGRVLVVIFLILAWINYPEWEAWLLTAAVLGALGAWKGWLVWRWWTERQHQKTWVYPAHLAAAHLVGLPVAVPPRSWLAIEPDRSRVVAELPPGYSPGKDDRERLVGAFTAKLGLESPEVRWMLAGPKPRLELVASVPSPPRVGLADIRGYLDSVKPDELIWGLGKRGVLVTTSLSGDSPHIGLSIGSGGGKSICARSLLSSLLYRGCLGVVLDIKQVSQHWAAFGSQLPNVIIARTPREIHHVLLWLAVELTRRNEIAFRFADIEGYAPPEVIGPRLVVVGEELNATAKALRAYWREVREKDDPTRSPALNALDTLSFMGRQANMNLVMIGQRLSVAASGGDGDSRENIGAIALGRYSPSNWKMMAPDFPMPPKSMTPGRLQIVTDQVREVQGIFMTGLEARQLAMAGRVSVFPPEAPGARVIAGNVVALRGADQHPVSDTPAEIPPAVPGRVTLSQAVEEKVVDRTLGALRIARFRGQLPEPVGQNGTAMLYDAEALRSWDLAGR